MKGTEQKLVALMEGSDKKFIIPVYQRNYDWKTANCKQLFDDLVAVIRKKRSSHFFGSIVSIHDSDCFNEHIIIDGQQRLTTVSLLMLALRNMIEEGNVQSKDLGMSMSEKLDEKYLIDKWSKGEKRIKLKPVKDDREAFNRLFDDDEENIETSNVTVNYEYFCKRILQGELTPDEVYEGIQRLEIINITLNNEDDPQLIFESLNSTGVALSEGDKIRNFILMGLPAKLQESYYNKYWNKIEKYTGYDVSAFVRDYISIKQHSTPRESNVYYVFKGYVTDQNLDSNAGRQDLLEDLLNYAKRYEILIGKRSVDTDVDSCIYRLNRLKTTVTRPFLLEVLRLYEENVLSLKDLDQIFRIVENYIIRRNICDVPTSSLNKIFTSLHREIERYDGTCDQYVEKMKYALTSKKENARFPDNREFKKKFSQRQVYKMNSKNKIYLLERFENYGTKEIKSIYENIDNGTYSIEHIMPQHLSNSWVESLGSDYKEIHENWLHRLANLTLTAYNGEYSNRSFEEKKTLEEKGFIDSGIKMNQYISHFDKWTLEELELRNQHMMKRALQIWEYPKTQYSPRGRQYNAVALDDADDLTNSSIVKFSFRGIEQPAASWIDMYLKVVKLLYDEDSSVIRKIAYEDLKSGLSPYFNTKQELLRTPSELSDGIYLEKNTSTQMKISVLQRLFDEYSVDPGNLVFYLKTDEENME